ncbi:MAG: hypothetical protein HYT30_02140 [Parcubacteria group bacterium]|nr:hypothetical protein [Parcubacteria group bacterium]
MGEVHSLLPVRFSNPNGSTWILLSDARPDAGKHHRNVEMVVACTGEWFNAPDGTYTATAHWFSRGPTAVGVPVTGTVWLSNGRGGFERLSEKTVALDRMATQKDVFSIKKISGVTTIK